MNENNQEVYTNGPYKATTNLNTAIGNPNININSATDSNLMENGQLNVGNQPFVNQPAQNVSQPIPNNQQLAVENKI